MRMSKKSFLRFEFIVSVVVGYFTGNVFWNQKQSTNCIFNSQTENLERLTDQQPSQSGFIYIGMMSTEDNLIARVAAAAETWAKHSNVKIEVFAKNNGTLNPDYKLVIGQSNDLRVVQLPGIKDNDYPPTKKFYSMLRFMYRFYISKFDWFVRLDDDAYVNLEKLHKFLSSINASVPWYIGQPGFGRSKTDLIEDNQVYCLGGTGIIFSRALMLKLAPSIGQCLQSCFTKHDDIEISRCVATVANISCTNARNAKEIFFQNYQTSKSYGNNIGSISTAQLDKGIVFHANKDPSFQYRFHVASLKHRMAHLVTRIAKIDFTKQANPHHNGVKAKYDSMLWNSLIKSHVYQAEDRESVPILQTPHRLALTKISKKAGSVLPSSINKGYSSYDNISLLNGLYRNQIRFLYTYHKVRPTDYVDYRCQMFFRYKPQAETKYLKPAKEREGKVFAHFRQTIVQSIAMPFFHELESIDMNRPAMKMRESVVHREILDQTDLSYIENIAINFVMALSGRPMNFLRFLHNFKNTFLDRGENVNLIVSYFPGRLNQPYTEQISTKTIYPGRINSEFRKGYFINREAANIGAKMRTLQELYQNSKIKVIMMTPGSDFSRGLGLQAAAGYVAPNEIIFFCDVDLVFARDILRRIRKNTIKGRQVYYPTFFSQNNPKIVYSNTTRPRSHFSFTGLDGFWRKFSYGMLSIYKSDFIKTKGFDLSIRGWGLEDERLIDSVVRTNLDVFRSNEPALVHLHHIKSCSSMLNREQQANCHSSKAFHYGPVPYLYSLWRQKTINVMG